MVRIEYSMPLPRSNILLLTFCSWVILVCNFSFFSCPGQVMMDSMEYVGECFLVLYYWEDRLELPFTIQPSIFFFKKKKRFYSFLAKEGKGGRETWRCERYNDRWPLTHPLLGTWPATRACALTGNQTSNLLVCRPPLNPLSHTSQG